MVLIPTMALRPKNSSGFSPARATHQNVRDKPSNETDESANTTNATPLRRRIPTSRSHFPGTAAVSIRFGPSSIRALSGDSQETTWKNTENAIAVAEPIALAEDQHAGERYRGIDHDRGGENIGILWRGVDEFEPGKRKEQDDRRKKSDCNGVAKRPDRRSSVGVQRRG